MPGSDSSSNHLVPPTGIEATPLATSPGCTSASTPARPPSPSTSPSTTSSSRTIAPAGSATNGNAAEHGNIAAITTATGTTSSQPAPGPSSHDSTSPDPRLGSNGTDPPAGPTVKQDWTPTWLRSRYLAGFFVATLSLISAIIVLMILSRNWKGITQVKGSGTDFFSYEIGIGLSWTSLPVLIFSGYGMAYLAVVNASGDRQPYVELYDEEGQEEGASFESSISLDYRSHNMFTKVWFAFKRRHLLLLIGFILAPVVTLFQTSLASHFFEAIDVIQSRPASVSVNTQFDSKGFTPRSQLIPIFELVTSTLIYGASAFPWTMSQYSFQNFSKPTFSERMVKSNNFSIKTTAYFAELDCKALRYNVDYTLTNASDTGVLELKGRDRGCPLSALF